LSDAGFLSRMMTFDAATLHEFPGLITFVATTYFGCSLGGGASAVGPLPAERRRASYSASPTRRWSAAGIDEVEPLSFERVFRASRAAAALFRWSASILVKAQGADGEVDGEADLGEEVDQEEVDHEALRARPCSPSTVQEELVVKPALEPILVAPTPNRMPERPAAASKPLEATKVGSQLMEPKPAPTPMPTLKASTGPDRHFEKLAPFVFGSSELAAEGEAVLQTVAATYCMRRRMRLRLLPCPDAIENDALARSRAVIAQEWLESNGLPADCLAVSQEIRPTSGEPGVVCQVLLDADTVLRDFYLMVAEGIPRQDAGTKDTLTFSAWLEENFQTRMH